MSDAPAPPGPAAGGATVWLGLGTNLGDRAANLSAAVSALRGVLVVEALSPVYESPPFGYTDQPHFWNMVVRARATLPPPALLSALKQLEQTLGRVPTFRMGPRSIDIDILLYDDVVLDSPALTLPHAGLPQRSFVLRPLLDLAPGLRHPVTGTALADYIAAAAPAGLHRLGAAAEVLAPGEGE